MTSLSHRWMSRSHLAHSVRRSAHGPGARIAYRGSASARTSLLSSMRGGSRSSVRISTESSDGLMPGCTPHRGHIFARAPLLWRTSCSYAVAALYCKDRDLSVQSGLRSRDHDVSTARDADNGSACSDLHRRKREKQMNKPLITRIWLIGLIGLAVGLVVGGVGPWAHAGLRWPVHPHHIRQWV